MFSLFNRDKKILKKLSDQSLKIDALSKEYEKLTDDELKNKTNEFKNRLSKGETLDDILVESFATVREAAKRMINEYPFLVQLQGAIALHNGDVAEMATGSGKTLTSTMAVYLNALTGNGVHVVTVNEYLAERDSEWMGQIYKFLGLTVGLNKEGMLPVEKRAAFNCDITYTTASELGFDYLRDNMITRVEDRVLRKLNYVVVDEADSILIDDARNPLIISGEPIATNNLYKEADMFAKSLKNEDYEINVKERTIALTRQGIHKAEKRWKLDNLYSEENGELVHYISQAIKANFIMKKDVDYIVEDNDIMLIDQNTGRKKPGTQWSDGLHQAVQTKEKVNILQETRTIATITYQNFFRLYEKLAGMTGTAKTEEEEFLEIYNMRVVPIPTKEPVIREDKPDFIYATKKAKFNAIVDEVEKIHSTGQPILIGTASVEISELLSKMLTKRRIRHEVLNAKNHAREAEIIALAGQKNAVTLATNMAGRGTDIKLGEGVKELGGLYVIGTERHESRRIDNQLRGRSGRQGDPGSSRFFVSLEDDLMVRFGGENIRDMFSQLGDMAIENKIVSKAITSAQARVEGYHFDIRKAVLDYDMVMATQRNAIYKERNFILEHENVREVIKTLFDRGINALIKNVANKNADKKEINYDDLFKVLEFTHCDFSKEELNSKTYEDIASKVCKKTFEEYEKRTADVKEQIEQTERIVALKNIDRLWMDHLDLVTRLKDGIGLRAYAQNNPLQAYREEAFAMFEETLDAIGINTMNFLTSIKIVRKEETEEKEKEL